MPREANKDTLRRRSLMLPASFEAEMAELREKTGAQSDSEIIRRAFKLFRRLALDPDLEIVVTDPKTGKTIQLLIV